MKALKFPNGETYELKPDNSWDGPQKVMVEILNLESKIHSLRYQVGFGDPRTYALNQSAKRYPDAEKIDTETDAQMIDPVVY